MTKYPNRSHPGVAGAKYKLGKAIVYIHAVTRQLSRAGEDYAAETGDKFADEIVRVIEGKPERRGMPAAEFAEMVADYEAAAVRASEDAEQPGGAG
jgi:hypothetical protein